MKHKAQHTKHNVIFACLKKEGFNIPPEGEAQEGTDGEREIT